MFSPALRLDTLFFSALLVALIRRNRSSAGLSRMLENI